jgi:hypothetical protein
MDMVHILRLTSSRVLLGTREHTVAASLIIVSLPPISSFGLRLKTRCTAQNVKTIDPSKFQEALESSELFTQPAATADDFADQLKTVVMPVLDRMAPLHTGVRRPAKRATRWLSGEAVEAKQHRLRLERRWLTTKAEVDRINYRRVCRSANKIK